MSKTYVDNAYNRKLGRVGKPLGTHAVYSSSSGATTGSATGGTRVYVDNAYNRKLGRVGKPLGVHVVHSSLSKGSGATTCPNSGKGVYVDNAYNRNLCRVGKPLGTHVVHSSASEGSGATTCPNIERQVLQRITTGWDSSANTEEVDRWVVNPLLTEIPARRSRSMGHQLPTGRGYVDNAAYNMPSLSRVQRKVTEAQPELPPRCVERMQGRSPPLVRKPISAAANFPTRQQIPPAPRAHSRQPLKERSTSQEELRKNQSSKPRGLTPCLALSSFEEPPPIPFRSTSTKDESLSHPYNQRDLSVPLPFPSEIQPPAPQPPLRQNRHFPNVKYSSDDDRSSLPPPVPVRQTSVSSGTLSMTELGQSTPIRSSASHEIHSSDSKRSGCTTLVHLSDAKRSGCTTLSNGGTRVCRKLGRVGTTLVVSSAGGECLHADNPNNRSRLLGHVGDPMPCKIVKEVIKKYVPGNRAQTLNRMGLADKCRPDCQLALEGLEQEEVETSLENEGHAISSDAKLLAGHIPQILEYSDLKVEKEIGCGGFGVVYSCLWKNKLVAYKKLLHQCMSKKSCDKFVKEIQILVSLNHPNTIKVFGVVVEEMKMGIVMEYMKQTLFQALFIDRMEYQETTKKEIVSKLASALQYLHMHEPKIAHRDIKSRNVLLDCQNNPKLCDFGLSMVRNMAETSQSRDALSAQGTPRYSAPEVLRGDILTMNQLLMADIYSLAIVVYEVVAKEEPFEDLSARQLEAHVGRGNLRPATVVFSTPLSSLLSSSWDACASNRLTATEFLQRWNKISHLYN